MKITEYRGYDIHLPTSGGKAGKGHNKTCSLQICTSDGRSRRVHKLVRFNVAEVGSRSAAVQKAKDYINANPIAP